MVILICIVSEVLLYILWCIYCYIQCKRTAVLITSAEIIIPFIFLIYSIFAPIFFLVEGKSLADRYFYISRNVMEKTCILYLGIFLIFLTLLFLDGAGERLARRKTDWATHYKYRIPAIWWDLIAIIIILYYVFRIISAGASWQGLGTLEKRNVVNSEFVTYLNIYMVAYSCKMIITIILNMKIRTAFNTMRVFIPIVFWCVYLSVTSRRYFLMVLPALFIALVAAENKPRLSKKWINLMGVSIISLLIMGAKRAFMSFSKATAIYYLHNMFAEFIYTYYVSCYFVGYKFEKQYGRTYLWETLTQWVPRVLYPNKHANISIRFWEMARTNVAYSFNPIAEGLYNFGWGAILVVPLVLYLYIKFANYMNKYSNILYMITVGSFVGFMRSNVSNCVMDLVMILLFCLLMNFDGGTYKVYVDNSL